MSVTKVFLCRLGTSLTVLNSQLYVIRVFGAKILSFTYVCVDVKTGPQALFIDTLFVQGVRSAPVSTTPIGSISHSTFCWATTLSLHHGNVHVHTSEAPVAFLG